ncbi:MAG TPA: L,D-transpeptidase [Methylophaga aminisulfidivorans]|uniref:L,D-transpeptidase n=1 Tax=Methylophaga TaxID=40222 RepID=UPI0017530E72|nr:MULTISPECIES: L,D-transpeptidase [Methylophaga]HIC46019.1 L,D-transpeptidase [Methylophaga sp.]HIM40505.1 L,D-transpeptidase [Methylophaga aminisulfidivorans]
MNNTDLIKDNEVWLDISLKEQHCWLRQQDQILFDAPVSTALNGAGEQNGSGCTPRGWHIIRAKIGEHQPINSVFVGRRPTAEIFSQALADKFPGRDWILTRILWLSGLEVGKNRLGNVDTMRRYIYIHGCPDSLPMGQALSHGCVRMRNQDVLSLFNQVQAGLKVWIHE